MIIGKKMEARQIRTQEQEKEEKKKKINRKKFIKKIHTTGGQQYIDLT